MESPALTKLRSFFDRHERLRSALAVIAMLFLTEAVYMRPEILLGTSSLMGVDYEMLHRSRLAFAREGLFGIRHALPAWNPHEVLGAPFAANLQGFPWIPARLVLLLLHPSVAYGAGIAMAAALAAIFAYLYCRRAGLTRIGSVAAGWTFACAGYFSSRVTAGHLPLLEVYPALPLLLWLVDRALAPERGQKRRFDLAVLALCCTCVVAAGHPQVPAYALAAAFLYVAFSGLGARGRGVGARLRARVAGAMVLGIGLALAIWWPMLMLIGRSTRLLHLAAPDNDVVMPYSRLLALIVPGIQGWADPVELADKNSFTGYANNSWFWDTASYIGIMPLVAIAALLVVCIAGRRMPHWRWRFLTFAGVGALVCSLPPAAPLLHLLPGTLLRSPARMLYISTFCAAAALGAGVDAVRGVRWPRRKWIVNAVLTIFLAFHFADLWRFAHWFIETYPRAYDAPAFQAILDHEVGSGRIAAAREALASSYEDRFDDAGGFDSIFLARFNRGYLALAGEPPDTNEQVFDASVLPVHALQAMGVSFVITTDDRTDLELAGSTDDAKLYRVANPAPRADFFAANRAEFAAEARIPALFAAGSWNRLLLTPDAKRYLPAAPGVTGPPARIEYLRPSSDEIVVNTVGPEPGFVHVLETFDSGWIATVDGATTPVIPANGFAMAVPVAAGSHTVRMRYRTPGRLTGVWLSLVSLALLTGLILSARVDAGKMGR
jgi:hypothetical protein